MNTPEASAEPLQLGAIVAIVCEELVNVCQLAKGVPLGEDTLMIEDLGLDSLCFVDLTLALEERLGLDEFPMQQWADQEGRKKGPKFTVNALARRCAELVAEKHARRSD